MGRRYRREVAKLLGAVGAGTLAATLLKKTFAQSIPQPEVLFSRYTPIVTADVIVFREGEYAVAVKGKTKEVIAKSTDHASVLRTAINNTPDYGRVVAIGNFELKSVVEISAYRELHIFGKFTKASTFSGTVLVRLKDQRSKLIGGLIDGVDKSVHGIELTGTTGYKQEVIRTNIINVDIGVLVTHESGGINYLGYIENVECRSVNVGIRFTGAEVHEWLVLNPHIWTYSQYGIVIDSDVGMARIYGGLVQTGESSSIDGILVRGRKARIRDVWIEHNGSGYAINIEPGAEETVVDRPYIAAGRIRDLGYLTKLVLEEPWANHVVDDLFNDADVDVSVSGSASYSVGLFGVQGAIRLSTGTTENSTATLTHKASVIPFSDFPIMTIRLRINDTANVKVFFGLYASSSYYALIKYDPTVSSNFVIEVNKGGTVVSTDTGVAPDTSWHVFKIQNNGVKGVTWFVMDRQLLGEISQAVTGVMLKPYVYIENLEATDKTVDIDWIELVFNRPS